jgi:hypothetical protein
LLGTVRLNEGTLYSGVFSLHPPRVLGRNLDGSEKMWLSLACFNDSGYQLAEGDIVKLGRVRFRVRHINIDDSQPACLTEPENVEETLAIDEEAKQQAGEIGCRICLSNASAVSNPLIAPCRCDGSMKWIHLRCLQNWLKTRMTYKATDYCLSFRWKTVACELCMTLLPTVLQINREVVELVDIPKPNGAYLVLELLCRNKHSERGLFLLTVADKKAISIGRYNSSEFKIADISVSRSHAVISSRPGAFYLTDTKSKFGTYVQVKRPLYLGLSSPCVIQTGRSLLTLVVKKPWSLIPSCLRRTPEYELFQSDCFRDQRVLPSIPSISLSTVQPSKQYSRNLMTGLEDFGLNSSYEDEGNLSRDLSRSSSFRLQTGSLMKG